EQEDEPGVGHIALEHLWQFGKEASQTRDYCVAKNPSALLRAGCDTSRGSPRFPRQARDRLFAAQRTLAQDDNQTAPLPSISKGGKAGSLRPQPSALSMAESISTAASRPMHCPKAR